MWTIISKELPSLDSLPFQQRGKVFAVTDVNNNEVFVVAFHETIMSVGPSAVKIRCQVKNFVDNRRLTLNSTLKQKIHI